MNLSFFTILSRLSMSALSYPEDILIKDCCTTVGLTTKGIFNENHDARGDVAERDITSRVNILLEEIKKTPNEYVVYDTPSPYINILASTNISHEYLLEVYVLSLIVNVYRDLIKIRDHQKVQQAIKSNLDMCLESELRTILKALDGENFYNSLNCVVDFSNKAIIGRRDCRLSKEKHFLESNPVIAVAVMCGVKKEKSLTDVPITIYNTSWEKAYEFLKQTCFDI